MSDLLVRERLLRQIQSGQAEMMQVQMQLSTGRRISIPSEDAPAALRAMSLQRLLERKDQIQTNLITNQSYLSATDSALMQVSNSMAEARGMALSVVGTTSSDTQRDAVIQELDQILLQLSDVGNQKFRGRYLFAGTGTTVRPFERTDDSYIQYNGNEGRLSSFSDIDLMFDTNLHGDEVFGALSEPVRGSIDLNPVVTHRTRLADLRGGRGITDGSISVTDGNATTIVDLSSAETVGDVAALLMANPPSGRSVVVEITPTGLRIE
ncbi:MAG: flagellar hook-associated protein FlgL, partial [Planctomycetes bacterium]|nr:flagellar hook-associated protein FlgL [Planctomycetota bacterium]